MKLLYSLLLRLWQPSASSDSCYSISTEAIILWCQIPWGAHVTEVWLLPALQNLVLLDVSCVHKEASVSMSETTWRSCQRRLQLPLAAFKNRQSINRDWRTVSQRNTMKVKCRRILIVMDLITFKFSRQKGPLLSGSCYLAAIFGWLKCLYRAVIHSLF